MGREKEKERQRNKRKKTINTETETQSNRNQGKSPHPTPPPRPHWPRRFQDAKRACLHPHQDFPLVPMASALPPRNPSLATDSLVSSPARHVYFRLFNDVNAPIRELRMAVLAQSDTPSGDPPFTPAAPCSGGECRGENTGFKLDCRLARTWGRKVSRNRTSSGSFKAQARRSVIIRLHRRQ